MFPHRLSALFFAAFAVSCQLTNQPDSPEPKHPMGLIRDSIPDSVLIIRYEISDTGDMIRPSPIITCTLADCIDGIRIGFDRPLSRYKIFYVVGSEQGYAECSIPSDAEFTSGAALLSTCTRDGFTFGASLPDEKPASASVVLLGDCDQVLFQGTVPLAWEGWFHPNGAACGPVCGRGNAGLRLAK